MTHDLRFGPAAQTPEQRAWVLQRMQDVFPSLKKRLTDQVRALHRQYVQGELSWEQMRQAMESLTTN